MKKLKAGLALIWPLTQMLAWGALILIGLYLVIVAMMTLATFIVRVHQS